jgi:class 3 adenylate cyclase
MSRIKKMKQQKATIISATIEGLILDPTSEAVDQLASLLESCVEIIERIVEYHGGKVISFGGRQFVLVFTGRTKENENIISALDAVLEIQSKLNDLAEDQKLEIALILLRWRIRFDRCVIPGSYYQTRESILYQRAFIISISWSPYQ